MQEKYCVVLLEILIIVWHLLGILTFHDMKFPNISQNNLRLKSASKWVEKRRVKRRFWHWFQMVICCTLLDSECQMLYFLLHHSKALVHIYCFHCSIFQNWIQQENYSKLKLSSNLENRGVKRQKFWGILIKFDRD